MTLVTVDLPNHEFRIGDTTLAVTKCVIDMDWSRGVRGDPRITLEARCALNGKWTSPADVTFIDNEGKQWALVPKESAT